MHGAGAIAFRNGSRTSGENRLRQRACPWAATCRQPAGKTAPSFAVWAVKDPTSGNLDRIQIVKGWSKHGQSFEKIFDVAWAGDRVPDKWTGVVPPIGSTVDIDNATYTNTIGAVELKMVWTDPEFDPSLHAFYYARVLEKQHRQQVEELEDEADVLAAQLRQVVVAERRDLRARDADAAGRRLVEAREDVHQRRLP